MGCMGVHEVYMHGNWYVVCRDTRQINAVF